MLTRLDDDFDKVRRPKPGAERPACGPAARTHSPPYFGQILKQWQQASAGRRALGPLSDWNSVRHWRTQSCPFFRNPPETADRNAGGADAGARVFGARGGDAGAGPVQAVRNARPRRRTMAVTFI